MVRLPKDDVQKQKILQQIMDKFDKDKIYNEKEVNDIIKSSIDDDHVLVRRELINFNYLGRDPYKGVYWVNQKKLAKEDLEKIALRSTKIKKIEEEA